MSKIRMGGISRKFPVRFQKDFRSQRTVYVGKPYCASAFASVVEVQEKKDIAHTISVITREDTDLQTTVINSRLAKSQGTRKNSRKKKRNIEKEGPFFQPFFITQHEWAMLLEFAFHRVWW